MSEGTHYTVRVPIRTEAPRRALKIDRAYTDAKVCLILAAALSASVVLFASALWLAHWITR